MSGDKARVRQDVANKRPYLARMDISDGFHPMTRNLKSLIGRVR